MSLQVCMRHHYQEVWPQPLTMSISSRLSLAAITCDGHVTENIQKYHYSPYSQFTKKDKEELWFIPNPNKPRPMAIMRQRPRKRKICVDCLCTCFVYVWERKEIKCTKRKMSEKRRLQLCAQSHIPFALRYVLCLLLHNSLCSSCLRPLMLSICFPKT